MKMQNRLLLTVLLAASTTLGFAQTNTPVVPPVQDQTNTPVAAPAVAAADTPAPSGTIAPPVALNRQGDEIVPLINIDDASLPDAIKTLARQAGINFQFDPRVLNPIPDATGKIAPQPSVTFRWENVTAMEALLAVLDNNNLQLVKDPKTKIARVTIKDTAALEPLSTRVFQLQYSSPSNLVAILVPTISARGRVIPDNRTSSLVVSATDREMESVEALITKLDSQTRQILIEARFLEINKNPRTSKGVDWTQTLQNNNISFGNGVAHGTSTTTTPGSTETTIDTLIGGAIPGITANTAQGLSPETFFLNSEGVRVALSFLNSDSDSETLATPRAVTLENVKAELSVVRNIPVFEEQQGANTGGSQQANTVKPNYVLAGPNGTTLNEVGVKLFVTPRVYGGSNVFLDLKPEISEKEPKPEVTILGGKASAAPIFARRMLTTQAMVPSGLTLVLGGLRLDNTAKSFTKVPFLGDLPGVGLLFRHDDKSRDKKDLVIFVTPTIIQAQDYQHSSDGHEFLKSKFEENPDKEWSDWDSGKPKDWTKPKKSTLVDDGKYSPPATH